MLSYFYTMKKCCFCLLILSSLFNNPVNAQEGNQYAVVDAYVQTLGSLDSQNLANIALMVTRQFPTNEQKARAIFYWLANNIELDTKALKMNDQRKSLPEDVVKYRKGTGLGFAKLFQEMSSLVNIRCLVVNGFARNNVEDINNPADESNHAWNVVQLGQSPEQWYFVDVARASGTTDKKLSAFSKAYTGNYFFTNKALFNLDHYPDNDAWQLGGGPKSLKDFYNLPIIYNTAYNFNVTRPTPYNGFIKTKTKDKVKFIIPVNTASPPAKITLIIDEGRRTITPEPMNFTNNGKELLFEYQFKTEDTYPVKIMFDGKPVLEYMVEANE